LVEAASGSPALRKKWKSFLFACGTPQKATIATAVRKEARNAFYCLKTLALR